MKKIFIHSDSSPSLCFLSGFISIVLYLLILILIVVGFRFYKETNYSASSKDTESVVDLNLDESIELSDVQELNKTNDLIEENNKVEIKNTIEKEIIQPQVKENIIKKTETIQNVKLNESKSKEEQKKEVSKEKKELNLDDIFSSITSETSQIRKAREEKIKEEQLLIKRKKLEEEQKARAELFSKNAIALQEGTKALEQASNNLKENVKQAMTIKINAEKPQFKGNEDDKKMYDEWFAQIEEALVKEWKKTGLFQQQSTSSKVRIKVDGNGKLYYIYMVYRSPYNEYNNLVISFLKKLGNKTFPIPPRGKSVEFNLVLKSDLSF